MKLLPIQLLQHLLLRQHLQLKQLLKQLPQHLQLPLHSLLLRLSPRNRLQCFLSAFKNIFKAATHPLTGPAEIAPQYEKIGNALILTAIVVVVISVISSCIDIPMYLIRIARYKEELSSRTFRELYGAGEIAWQIVKYSVYPFIYYAIRTFGMAGVFMLAGLILKENFSFPRLLAIASLSVAPAYLVSEVCTSIFGLIPYVRFGSIFSVATYAYFLIMLFEGMRAETKLKGNKYGFVFIICLTIVGYVAGFF